MLSVLGILSMSTVSCSSPLLLRLLSASVSVAPIAGNKIADILQSGKLGVKEKAPKDLQTLADCTAQRIIVDTLLNYFPKLQIIGEESAADVKDLADLPSDFFSNFNFDESTLKQVCPAEFENITEDDIIVYVDPLDGTAEFVQGFLDHVTVLIGITVRGKSVAGVIHQPFFNYQAGPGSKIGRTIWGMLGLGCHGVDIAKAPTGENILTCTRSHSDPINVEAVTSCNPTRTDKVGGCGHKVLRVLEGQAHAYVFASGGCSKWDTAGPEAVIEAAGGRLTDICGVQIPYTVNAPRKNVSGVLATMENHDWYVNKIPQHIHDKFTTAYNQSMKKQ